MSRDVGVRARLGAAAVIAVLALTSCSPSAPAEGELPVVAVSPTARPTAVVDVPVAAATVPPVPAAKVEPVRVAIPGRDIELPIRAVGVEDSGEMQIPANPAVAGWYRYGPEPGAAEGSAVLAAHVDSRRWGIGPLAGLRELDRGERVVVRTEDGDRIEYVIESVTYIPRAELPVADLFGREGRHRLVIITCGGSFDEATRTYSDNVVAIAVPVSP